MGESLVISRMALDQLRRRPDMPVEGHINGAKFVAKAGISDYVRRIARHYADIDDHHPNELCTQLDLPAVFDPFGFICEFRDPLEVAAYDDDMVLADGLREIVRLFGPVIFRNVYMNADNRAEGHKARFEQLNFHYDRGRHHPDQHSMYIRDPYDPAQKGPRGASTLFVSNVVASLQYTKEQNFDSVDERSNQRHYNLFSRENVDDLIGEIVFEQDWTAPDGVGEMIVIDNRTVFHSSYYKTMHAKGWKIGVRYLK